MNRALCIAALAISLGACSSPAPQATSSPAPDTQTAATAPPPESKPDANAVNPDAIQALKDMGGYLQTLKQFSVKIDLDGERVLEDGQKLQHSASARVDADRPDKMRVQMRSARAQRDLYYDGHKVALYYPESNYYSTVDSSDNLSNLVVKLRERFGIEVPVDDLFLWGTPNAPTNGITSAMVAGQDLIDGQLCDQYAFRQGMIDWQIWIASGNQPLPRKIVVTNRSDEARPQSVTWLTWNLKPKFTASTFHFTPPKGAKVAEFVPLKNQ
ncbi:DUF2092 domain-containing protein [Cupriavidus metallidurans]|uniref:DUF2092 domain-containing protein n=1 Tax=Cupriavidus TaxID=106589 RepID=UPI0002A3E95C|nr:MULTISPECIES: DUF2092 domain-containing protein [unclassified Cupriavidus]EKZ99656.1 hypothetical protein D769_09059 [Cupriavidus sp. HMR-1]GMG92360.1 hypothetical protein Cmtc_35800 [Cupriavidus sp. TKC]